MKTGIATVPLDYGKCPRWLFERMKRLARAIILAVVEEFGTEELLKRLSDPVWFQSLGCVIGFDWNSSGLTTTTLGALKAGIFGLEKELGLFICGGKGKTSKKTPQQIQNWGELLGFSQREIEKLVYASKISAKVDSCLIQGGFQIYHHNFIFTKEGQFSVVQQGMNTNLQKARRYHWLSLKIKDFTEEPHSGIITDGNLKLLNLVSKESRKNKEISAELVKEEPQTFLRDIKIINEKSDFLLRQKRLPGFCEMELKNREFQWHPVLKEKFNLKRLKKIVEKAHFLKPENFENLLMVEGVGPRTIRALSLVAEVIYGAKPSYEDPARYSFAVGGKDGTPYFVEKETYDKLIKVTEKALEKSRISYRERLLCNKRLNSLFNKK